MNIQTELNFDGHPTVGQTSGALLWVQETAKQLEKFQLDIDAALSYSSYSHSFDTIVAMIMTGKLKFIPLEKSFLITEFHTTPNYTTYHVFLAGGDLEELMAYQPELEKTAKEANCKYLSLTGRRGWEKPLKTQGWRLQYVTLYKEIDE